MRLYRALLLLYPASFRGEYRDELCAVFAERRRRTSGVGPVAVLWLDAIRDVCVNAARVHADILRQDLRYARRSLTRTPGFALTAVLVIALGIGANSAVFSLTDQVFLRPLPYADSDRLVKVWENVPGYTRMETSAPNFVDWRRMSRSFTAMGAFQGLSRNLVGGTEPRLLEGATVDANVLRMLGVSPRLGRIFADEDDRPGAPATVVLSYALWRSEFGGRADVLGTRVRLDETEHLVIGVMPPAFMFPTRNTQIWTPLQLDPAEDTDRDNNYLHVLARLEPEMSLEAAQAEMNIVTEQLERDYPKENLRTRATVHSLRDQVPAQNRLMLVGLAGASFCVLLIACTNLASLLLTRVLKRRKELAMRTALGAGRERLVRQLLTESLVLALLGGLLGVAVAIVAVPLLARLVPPTLPVAEATAVDLAGFDLRRHRHARHGPRVRRRARGPRRERSRPLRPPRRIARRGGRTHRAVAGPPRVGGSGGVGGPAHLGGAAHPRAVARSGRRPRLRNAGRRRRADAAAERKYAATGRRVDLYSRILSDVRALPGVTSAAFISSLPMVLRGGIWPVEVEGASTVPEELRGQRAASLRYVTPGFFSTLQIPLGRGRDITESDTQNAPGVAVVSESFASRYWPGQDPLGKRFTFAFLPTNGRGRRGRYPRPWARAGERAPGVPVIPAGP